ncbi:hypothetical protein L484_012691 [Morus notabilis]|uniref:F-box protein At3g26010-like beta-propeller domain-containing protein n=1 Tax=Morus notabilis TaxID=981085 RepID=W9SHV2_9ROSA|nr:hypothetical protein L484_012691 [Morus notabilis]
MVETRRSKRLNTTILALNHPLVELTSKRNRKKIKEKPASKFISIVSDDLLLCSKYFSDFLMPETAALDLRIPWTPSLIQAVATDNGMLQWLLAGDVRKQIKGILAINPFKNVTSTSTTTVANRCRFIDLPRGFGHGWQASKDNLCLGVVDGRLRLSQFLSHVKDMNIVFVLKVWELNDASEKEVPWLLMHEVSIKQTLENTNMSVLSFHPNNGDVIFVLCGHNNHVICEYKIGEDKYEKVGEFPDGDEYALPYKDEKFQELLGVFTLVHPSWPTPIPT